MVEISRRAFLGSAAAAALSVAEPAGAKFYKTLGAGSLGVKADSRRSLELAVRYGFEGIDPRPGDFENATDAGIVEWLEAMKAKGIRYGAAGLPADFRGDDGRFQKDLERLPRQAALLRRLGVARVATWITPGHPDLPFAENFERHRRRLGECARVLKDHGLRLGLEFVGPKTSRARARHPFIHDQKGMMELVAAIGTGNVGLLLDSWHWYTSHGTVEDLRKLRNEDVVHVHVNDAPAGIPVDEQVDNRRRLPTVTGVIDLKGFMNALAGIGYDGPVECEPFDADLRGQEETAILEQTRDALDRLWGLVERG
jgi:sugar phosphate isomerase/epimerase